MSESVTACGIELYITCTALIVNCAMALAFLFLSWELGGDEYKDSIYGNHAIAILLLGIAAGIAIRRFCKRRRQAES